MRGRSKLGALGASAIAAAAIGVPIAAGSAHSKQHPKHKGTVSHVLLISVDGMHQSDLQWYVDNHPGSALAKLAGRGAQYTNARTPIPSDSFPGLLAQTTGGSPRTTGVYYDNAYSHAVLPPGTTSCPAGAPLGGKVIYDSPDDKDSTRLDAGQGLTGLPGSIMQMTSKPGTVLNQSTFPVDPATCKPIFGHQYLQVNTIFNVIHNHGLRTAWSDKHPAYEILNGPGGNSINDLFAPEIDSNALKPDGTPWPGGVIWTADNAATMQYDSYKVQAVLNEIDGFDHSGKTKVGVPAILGMNFQTVSTAQKLPTSDGMPGGYLPGTRTPAPLLRRVLQFINDKLKAMVSEVKSQHLATSTAIIVSAKHGQSPQDPTALTRIDDGPIIDGINAAWKMEHPTAGNLVAQATDDDAIQMWLSDRSKEATDFVKHYLLSTPAMGNTVSGGSRTLPSSGLTTVYAGKQAARYFGVPVSDQRYPDVWGIVQHGVVYTGGTGKIAEHGGAHVEDRHVPIVVYAPGTVLSGVFGGRVKTQQIAPTILQLLGLKPSDLKAVQIEGTEVLPGA